MNASFSSFVKPRWIRFVLWGFDLLYHGFAWMYDFAAWVVSAGKWNDWIRLAGWLADCSGPMLDLGCGKGILLQHAVQRGISAVGLDESPQMLRYSRRLVPEASRQLIRGLGQAMPIRTGTFQTVTATFPASYIFEPATLNEIRRVLKPEGRLIILLASDVIGSSVHERLIRFFSGFFGFGRVANSFQDYLQKPLRECGFTGRMEWIPGENARLLVILAQPV